MAHFAKLGVGNIVEQVIVVHNNDLLVDGVETESKGIEFLHNLFNNSNTVYKQTSYNGTFRKNYGGVGYTYDLVRNAFIPPQPFISWSLNEGTCLWDPPTPYPDDGNNYRWNDSTQAWDAV